MALPSPLGPQLRQLYAELAVTRAARELAERRANGAFLAGLITGGILAGATGLAVGLALGVRALPTTDAWPTTEETS